jgi:phage-related protein
MKILKKIQLPKSFYNPVMYIGNSKLIVIASGNSGTDYSKRGYYINRSIKTYTIVFDTTDKEKPRLEKLYVNDGDVRKTRKI